PRPTPEPLYVPICSPAGVFAALPNHVVSKFAMFPAAVWEPDTSMKMTDSPAPMLVIPLRGTAKLKELELSSIFQPLMFTALAPVFGNANQSSATGLLPLDHGATSEMMMAI